MIDIWLKILLNLFNTLKAESLHNNDFYEEDRKNKIESNIQKEIDVSSFQLIDKVPKIEEKIYLLNSKINGKCDYEEDKKHILIIQSIQNGYWNYIFDRSSVTTHVLDCENNGNEICNDCFNIASNIKLIENEIQNCNRERINQYNDLDCFVFGCEDKAQHVLASLNDKTYLVTQISCKDQENFSVDHYSMGNGYILIKLNHENAIYGLDHNCDNHLFLQSVKEPIKIFKKTIILTTTDIKEEKSDKEFCDYFKLLNLSFMNRSFWLR
ncbi:MAG: hypothetical protein KC414_13865 [Romboutsia sp.]|nr:hypothetical protein [Romboutsia sp.]